MKFCQRLSVRSPDQSDRSVVCVSSKMIGRSHGWMIAGASLFRRSARVASARTHRDGLRVPQIALDDFIERLAGAKRRIPPDVEALLAQALGEQARGRAVLTGVGQEDVSSGHVSPVRSVDSNCSRTDRKPLRAQAAATHVPQGLILQ